MPTAVDVSPEAAPAAPTLVRRLGPIDAAAIVVSNVIGGGIFFVPIQVAQMVPDPAAMLAVWALGGALALAGAMSYAELAALRPRAGGEYVYLREAFGAPAAFLTGWTSFVAGFSGAIAASAVGLADYIGRFLPAAADRSPLLSVPVPFAPLVVSRQSLVALTAIAALSFIHVRGLGPGRLVQNTLAVLKTTGLVLLVALGLTLGHGSLSHFAAPGPVPVSSWVLALVPIMFSYSGWNAAAYVAEEIASPGRNVPLALGIGTVTVVAIYLALNTLYLYAMPLADLASLKRGIVDETADRLFGFAIGNLLSVFTIVSIAASISAMIFAGPRVYYAMARDGLFFPRAATVHPTFRTPHVAIVAQSVWSGVLVLSGSLAELVGYTGFAVVLFSGIAVLGLVVLRRRHPDEPRPFRAWGYPLSPAVFVGAAAVMLGNQLWRDPVTVAKGLVVIGAGVPLYVWWSAQLRGATATGAPR
ncbi:MAG: amino acid permease [Vicinamibacterales bacterium]